MNTSKYEQHSYNARYNAQHNLRGRSHFVDDDTLRYFKGRVLSAYDSSNGRLFVVVHSQASGFNDATRVYSYAIFDLAGNGRFANDISYARQKWTPALEDAA